MRTLRLLSPLIIAIGAWANECSSGTCAAASAPLTADEHASVGTPPGVRPARAAQPLADIVGLEPAKALLNEALVLPAAADPALSRLFWRSADQTATLIVGPVGLGKLRLAEAAAAAAGAQVLKLAAVDAADGRFCEEALAAAESSGGPVVVLVEALETAPAASFAVRECLRDAGESGRIFVVATMGCQLRLLDAPFRGSFGYVAQLGPPETSERKEFLKQLLKKISRVDPQWASALREANVDTLANLTATYTFSEIDLVVRRAFFHSTNSEGTRDPVALHHFEEILALTPPHAAEAFNEAPSLLLRPPLLADSTSAGTGEVRKQTTDGAKKKPKDVKDPMDGIFGWCNFWLPEAIQLPPVVWAMIIFGILAHLMARSTYQPYGHRKKRGGAGGRNSLFGDVGGGSAPFGDQLGDWGFPGGSPFAGFPPPPGMAGPEPDASQ